MIQYAARLISLMSCFIINVSLGLASLTENGTSPVTHGCRFYGFATKIAYIGWPFELHCSDGLTLELWMQLRKKGNISCTIKDSDDTVLMNATFKTIKKLEYGRNHPARINVTTFINSTYSFEMKVHNDFCGLSKVRVVGKSYEEKYNCTNLPSSYNGRLFYVLGEQMSEMTCEVPYNGEDTIKLYGSDSEYTYEWWYNCSSSLPRNVIVNKQTTKKLRFYNASFSMGGEYVCAVRYKDQVRFLYRHILCVKRPKSRKITMICPKRVGGKEGSDIFLTCYIDVGIGNFMDPFYPVITWYNSTKASPGVSICSRNMNLMTDVDVITDNDKVKCINVQPKKNIFNQVQTCFQYQPPPHLDVLIKQRYNITLQIKNLRQWDVGKYNITHLYSGDRKSRSIEVYLDSSAILMSNTLKAAIGVSITVLVIFLLIIGCWRKYDILWFYKKHFGSYELERKKYDVFLLYHYSRDGMRVGSKLCTEKLIDNIQSFLDEKGLTFYDENREDVQLQNSTKILEDCHRILIIVNEELAFDERNLHQVYAAIENFAKGGTNVIFISLPGLERKFRNSQYQTQIALKHAMKIGATIRWSGKAPFDAGFKRRLEYVLPKNKPINQDEHQLPLPGRGVFYTIL